MQAQIHYVIVAMMSVFHVQMNAAKVKDKVKCM